MRAGVAAIPDGGGTFTACYQGSDQILDRVVVLAQPGEACPATYERVTWAQTGPQGAAGAPGPRGPAGAIDARYRSFRDAVTGRADAFKTFTVPAGSWVVLATATVDAQRATGALCILSGPGGVDQQEFSDFDWSAEGRRYSPIHKGAIALPIAGTSDAPETVAFGCSALDAPVGVRDIRILAIPVDHVTSAVESDPLTLAKAQAKIRALVRVSRLRISRSRA